MALRDFHFLSNTLTSNSTLLTALHVSGAKEAVPPCELHASKWHNDKYAKTTYKDVFVLPESQITEQGHEM